MKSLTYYHFSEVQVLHLLGTKYRTYNFLIPTSVLKINKIPNTTRNVDQTKLIKCSNLSLGSIIFYLLGITLIFFSLHSYDSLCQRGSEFVLVIRLIQLYWKLSLNLQILRDMLSRMMMSVINPLVPKTHTFFSDNLKKQHPLTKVLVHLPLLSNNQNKNQHPTTLNISLENTLLP